jgi:RsiW-degrading membrane proteinase PrsW (M82 family)
MLLLTAVAPTIALLCYFYKRDKYEREPRRLLLKAFLMGCVSVIPVIFVELQLNLFENADESLIAAGYTAFIVAGLVEEAFKYLVFYHYIWKHREFDEMYDGIIYCVFISLGFATVENIGYVVGSGFSTAFIRAMTAVPAHALFGVAMGYYLGIAKFISYSARRKYMRLGFFVPIILHGIYDFILFSQRFYLLAIFVPYMLYLWRRGLRNVDELVEASPYKRYPEEENE